MLLIILNKIDYIKYIYLFNERVGDCYNMHSCGPVIRNVYLVDMGQLQTEADARQRRLFFQLFTTRRKPIQFRLITLLRRSLRILRFACV